MNENRSIIQNLADDIESIYSVAGAKISGILEKLMGSDMGYRDISAARGKIEATINYLNVKANAWTVKSLPVIYCQQRGQTEKILKRMYGVNLLTVKSDDKLKAKIRETQGYFHRANASIKTSAEKFFQVAESATIGIEKLKFRIQEMSGKDDATIRKIIETTLNDPSYIHGSHGTQWASSRIRDYLRAMVDGDDFIEINGRFYTIRKYAVMLARTELSNTMFQAVKDECEKWGNDLVEFSSHDKPCPECAQHEGEIFSLSGNDPDYPLCPNMPIHPNCEHNLNPTSRVALRARGAA